MEYRKPTVWTLTNEFTSVDVLSVGASIDNLVFSLPDSIKAKPLASAPWGEPELKSSSLEYIPAHLQFLGGEWPCVPFGSISIDESHHGFCTDHEWDVCSKSKDRITLRIIYPDGHIVNCVERSITLAPDQAAVDFSLTIDVNQACKLPVGLHPIFAVPRKQNSLFIKSPEYTHARTIIERFSPPTSRFVPDTLLNNDGNVEVMGGGNVNIWRHPLPPGEDLVQLWDTDGQVELHYPYENYKAVLTWDETLLPHCLLWVANPGVTSVAQLGDFYGIGVEPVNSWFDRNDDQPVGRSGEGVDCSPDELLCIRYRLACQTL